MPCVSPMVVPQGSFSLSLKLLAHRWTEEAPGREERKEGRKHCIRPEINGRSGKRNRESFGFWSRVVRGRKHTFAAGNERCLRERAELGEERARRQRGVRKLKGHARLQSVNKQRAWD